ncbi:RNA polymerase principal sigma factor HrdA [Rubripirellula lacrimiformis]|uniref:RNA polymerase principal sigma factor HrdA n=1 Tax=Rubripirellula lacrimiformis TaxID=1930273 RepID=A0A517N9K8_9BACT|nr:sigma-70 family RNA polymerase sigma factor [Rubripirellula lacrimiformis]QDT03821.1 RNA polymerase principal sigma factor HrdA [Rubripirellula lacrimiformis]
MSQPAATKARTSAKKSRTDRTSESSAGTSSAVDSQSDHTELQSPESQDVDGQAGIQLTATAVPARTPGWLKSSELASANSDVAETLKDLAGLDSEQLRRLTQTWLKRELAFISNPGFTKATAGKTIFATSLDLQPRKSEQGIAAVRKSGVDLPIHLCRLCEASLLTPEQEVILFQRFNFLMHQASVHRSLLNVDRPSRARLALVERFVALAEWHRDRIVEANLRLVFSIVKKFVNPNNTFDDLLSDGIVGLIRAVEKFDFDRGFRFSTYATQVVRRGSYQTVVTNQQDRQKVIGGLQDMDIEFDDETRVSAISEKRWHELRSRLAVMLDALDRREKLIIRARFSLGSHRKVHTLQSLADRLGISKERVRQLERRAMDKLRDMSGDASFAELEQQ